MEENDISFEIRGAIYNVYNELGSGLLESVYKAALKWELVERGLKVNNELPLPVYYKNYKIDVGFRIDLLVENKVILEVKSVENLSALHHKQVLTYLKVTNLKLGILVNFNVLNINEGIFRKLNNF
jgi:GxxExxY protein